MSKIMTVNVPMNINPRVSVLSEGGLHTLTAFCFFESGQMFNAEPTDSSAMDPSISLDLCARRKPGTPPPEGVILLDWSLRLRAGPRMVGVYTEMYPPALQPHIVATMLGGLPLSSGTATVQNRWLTARV